MPTTCRLFLFVLYFLGLSSPASSKGSCSSVDFKTRVYHGHVYVTWIVVDDYLKSEVPINYTINYCPPQLNLGYDACNNVIPVCSATYIYNKNASTPQAIHAGNMEKYLTKGDFEELNDTIETSGSLIEVKWVKAKNQFICKIFVHRCMDGQFNPYFMYEINNGSTATRCHSDHIFLRSGPAAKAENISIQQINVGCCSINVTVTWEIIHVCRVDVPTFDVWLTASNKTVSKMKMVNTGVKIYSFEIMFGFLLPSTQHVLHIDSYKMTGGKTYANKSFWTRTAIPEGAHLNTTATGERGFLILNWHVENELLNSIIHVLYNISWCPQHINRAPYTCKNSTTVCSAVYNGAKTYINAYEDNVLKYADFIGIPNGTSRKRKSWVTGTWDEGDKSFSCGMFLNACQKSNRIITMKMDVEINGTYSGPEYRTIAMKDGFSSLPEHVTVTTILASVNSVSLTVKWQLRKMCSPNAATSILIWITRKEDQYDKKRFTKDDATKTESGLMDYQWSFKKLQPHMFYTVHIQTKGVTIKHVEKTFWTLEGVPTTSPKMDYILSSACYGEQRNISLWWKMPGENTWNGVMRNIGLTYWGKNRPDNKTEVILGNITLWTLVGLKCHVDYQVKVRACLRRTAKCSEYSAVQNIGKIQRSTSSSKSKVGRILLWTGVGVVLVFLLVALICYQCCRRRRRRNPIKQCDEDSICSYTSPFQAELSQPGIYNRLEDSSIEI